MKGDARIMVVDDDESFREMPVLLLNEGGYQNVRTAENGEKARSVAREYRPHLVLMDTEMPGRTGIEVCCELRAAADYPLKIIGMLSDPRYSKQWSRAGADAFYHKPDLASSRIKEIVGKYLDEQDKR